MNGLSLEPWLGGPWLFLSHHTSITVTNMDTFHVGIQVTSKLITNGSVLWEIQGL